MSVLGRLSDLKYGDKVRAIEIAEADKNFQQANRLRKQLIKIQDVESEISAQIQNWSRQHRNLPTILILIKSYSSQEYTNSSKLECGRCLEPGHV
jgi:hypothetical protein